MNSLSSTKNRQMKDIRSRQADHHRNGIVATDLADVAVKKKDNNSDINNDSNTAG